VINGLFEIHINVSNADISAEFYENGLGLERIFYDNKRRSYFFIGLVTQVRQC
jgi:catechol-2,3-dioxygenase